MALLDQEEEEEKEVEPWVSWDQSPGEGDSSNVKPMTPLWVGQIQQAPMIPYWDSDSLSATLS